MEVPIPLPEVRPTMGAYERIKEELKDAENRRKKRKTVRRQLTAPQRVREDHARKKSRAWRYYKSAAIARKAATQKEKECHLDEESG